MGMMNDRTNRHAELCPAVIAEMAMLISGSPHRTAVRVNRMVSPSGFLKMLDANFLSWKLLEILNNVYVLFLFG